MSKAVQLPELVALNGNSRVPNNVPSLATADGLGSANVGVIIDKPEKLTLHGAPDNESGMVVAVKNQKIMTSEGEKIQEVNECRNIGAWLARWMIEMCATLSIIFVFTAATILFPQQIFGSAFSVAFALMGITLITHILFSYATGVYMNVYISFWVTIAHWIVRGMSSERVYFLNDIVKLIIMWSAQIAGSFVGVILALILFLDGVTPIATLSALSAPHYGSAPWIPGPPKLVTDFQAGAFECVGSFVLTVTVLYCYGAKKLHKKIVWAGLIRGGSVFIVTMLFYNLTGASFNPFRWVVPFAYAGAGYGSVQKQIVYALVPFIGGAIATLFFIIWVAINKYCLSGGSLEYHKEKNGASYQKLENEPDQPAGQNVSRQTGGLIRSNAAKVY